MPKKRTKTLTPEQQTELTEEMEAKLTELIRLIEKLSFLKTEAIVYKAARTEAFFDGQISTVGVAYAVPSSEAFETRLAENLHERLSETVEEWKQWVKDELRPDENTPF